MICETSINYLVLTFAQWKLQLGLEGSSNIQAKKGSTGMANSFLQSSTGHLSRICGF